MRNPIYQREKPPPTTLPPGQVWVWMHGPGKPHWEVRGTGVIFPTDDPHWFEKAYPGGQK